MHVFSNMFSWVYKRVFHTNACKESNCMNYSKFMERLNKWNANCKSGSEKNRKTAYLAAGTQSCRSSSWDGISSVLASMTQMILTVYHLLCILLCDMHMQMTMVCSNLREMIKNAKAWAQTRGLCEVNEVHGREEFRIPTERMFEHTRSSGTLTSQKINFTAEDTSFATNSFYQP